METKKEVENNLLALAVFIFGYIGVMISLLFGYGVEIKVVKKEIKITPE